MASLHFVLVTACTLALAACDSPRSQLDSGDLDAAERHVASIDAEAQVFAREIANGSVTRAFALSHRQALVQESLQAGEEIAKPAPESLRSRRDALALRNARVRDAVLALETGA